MRNTKAKILAVAVCAAVVVVLGLTACDSSSSAPAANSVTSAPTSEATSTANTESTAPKSESTTTSSEGPITSAAEELFSNWLQGIDDNGVIYFYADDTTEDSAMLMIYDTENDTFASYTGKLEKPSDGTIKIDTKRAGESIAFKTAAAEDGSGVVYTFSNGSSVTMGPLIDDDVRDFLRSLDEFASEMDESPAQDGNAQSAQSDA